MQADPFSCPGSSEGNPEDSKTEVRLLMTYLLSEVYRCKSANYWKSLAIRRGMPDLRLRCRTGRRTMPQPPGVLTWPLSGRPVRPLAHLVAGTTTLGVDEGEHGTRECFGRQIFRSGRDLPRREDIAGCLSVIARSTSRTLDARKRRLESGSTPEKTTTHETMKALLLARAPFGRLRTEGRDKFAACR
jgi:hypothetical protein